MPAGSACGRPVPADAQAVAGRRPAALATVPVVTRVLVEVMPRSEVLDPQGQAVHAALTRLGVASVRGVRQGKRFEIEVEGELDETTVARLREAADGLLANPVIETWVLSTEP